MTVIENFHFLRPLWLFALLGLFLLPALLRLHKNSGGAWQSICDSHLLEVLLTHQAGKREKLPLIALAAAYILSIFALSGPTWERLPMLSVSGGTNTVFVLDVGVNMGAEDINPSRLERAKYKLFDLLEKVKGDQAALVLFDNEAYTASPLSEDMSVLANIIPTLDLSVMPGNGASVIEKGIDEALRLLESANAGKGRIILITGAGKSSAVKAQSAVRKAADKGHVVSVLAVGSEGGAPVPAEEGGFYKSADGTPILFKTGIGDLKKLAAEGNGGFSPLKTDDKDLSEVLVSPLNLKQNVTEKNIQVDTWKDMGVYLLLLIIPLFLFAFKGGFIAVIALFVFNPSVSHAGAWTDLWFNQNQQGMTKLKEGRYDEAADKFNNPSWKGYALYKANDYKSAVSNLSGLSDVTSLYNLGNARAFSGDIAGAIAAYDEALKINPEHEDALYNREYLKKEQEKQKQKQEQEQEQNKENQPRQQKNPDNQNPDSSEENRHEEERKDKGEEEQKQEGSYDAEDKNQKAEDSGLNEDKQEEKQPDFDRQSEAEKSEKAKDAEAALSESQKGEKRDKAPEFSESEQADIQWLNRIQEDKGALLRARLKKIYQQKRGND